MNAVDFSGWVEYLTDSPNAYIFEPPIQCLETRFVIAGGKDFLEGAVGYEWMMGRKGKKSL
jgi:hypothetical protein